MLKTFKKNKFTLFVIGLSVAFSVVAVIHWFWGNHILYFWDAYLPFDPKISFEHLFYLWRERLFPGYATASWSWIIYWLIFFLPYAVFQSLSFSEFFMYVLLLSFSTVNFYFLSSNILALVVDKEKHKNLIKISALITAFLYTFNIYTFSNFYFMFNPGSFILAFLPLNLLALIKMYPMDNKKEGEKTIKWFSIFIISMMGMIPGFTVYVFFLQYIVWMLVYLIVYWFTSKYKIFSRGSLEIVLFFILTIFVNLWWFVPAFIGLQEAYTTQSSFGTTIWFDRGFEPSQLLNSMRLMGSGLMTNNRFSWTELYESSSIFNISLFVFPLLFLLSLTLLKRDVKNILIFFLWMTLVSLFIVKFSNPPLAWILGFAYHYIPFFGGFRDAFQKSGVYFIPGYFIFISIGLVLSKNYLYKKNMKYVFALLIIVFVVGSVILSGPFFLFMKDNIRVILFTYDGKNYNISAKTKVPQEYYSLKSFLEKKCKGETIINIPRSGFVTDGIWEKYNTSYVGQDILAGLVECNFLSTAMFVGASENAIQVPYLFLQQDDLDGFKNYLRQNSINYILIRKDFIPDNLVSWIYVDPKKTEKLLVQDNEFQKIYTNDFFSVFKRRTMVSDQFGFSLSNNVIYRPDLENAKDYAVVSKMVGDLGPSIFLSSPIFRDEYADKSTVFAAVANCIGCIKIEPKEFLAKNDLGFIQKVKRYIKNTIFHENINVPNEIQISLDILKAHGIYSQILTAIEDKEKNVFERKIDEYIMVWKNIRDLYDKYNANRFARNNKSIEIINFLSVEKNITYNEFSSEFFKDKKFVDDLVSRNKFTSLLKFQDNLLSYFSKNIIDADLTKGLVPLRLDIRNDGEYTCRPIAMKNNVNFTSLSIEQDNLTSSQMLGAAPIFFKKGSHLLHLTFATKEIFNAPGFTQANNQVRKMNIGHLEPGSYKLSFESTSKVIGKMVAVVSQGEMPENILENLSSKEKLKRNIYMIDFVDHNLGGLGKFEKNFEVDLISSQDYYLYLQSIIPEDIPAEIHNLTINTAITQGGDIQFGCSTNVVQKNKIDEKVEVKKESAVKYEVKLPEGYKGFLIFNQTADPNWVARENGSSSDLPHFISGHANAWYIKDPKSNTIVVEYKVQSLAARAAYVSVGLSLLLMIVYIKIRRPEK